MFQHIKISIQQLLRPDVGAHALAAHVSFIQRQEVGYQLVLIEIIFQCAVHRVVHHLHVLLGALLLIPTVTMELAGF